MVYSVPVILPQNSNLKYRSREFRRVLVITIPVQTSTSHTWLSSCKLWIIVNVRRFISDCLLYYICLQFGQLINYSDDVIGQLNGQSNNWTNPPQPVADAASDSGRGHSDGGSTPPSESVQPPAVELISPISSFPVTDYASLTCTGLPFAFAAPVSWEPNGLGTRGWAPSSELLLKLKTIGLEKTFIPFHISPEPNG